MSSGRRHVWRGSWPLAALALLAILIPAGQPALAQATFTANGPYPFPAALTVIATGDVNGDGIPDLAGSPQFSTEVYFALGDGTGGFTQMAGSLNVGFTASALAFADLDGDQDDDLLVGSLGTPELKRYENLAGAFALIETLDPGGQPNYILVDDFQPGNGIDFLVLHTGSNLQPPGVRFYANQGTGSFSAAGDFPVGANPLQMTLAELNGDGLPDLVVASAGIFFTSVGEISVLLGTGPGSFGPATGFGPEHPSQVVVEDLVGGPAQDVVIIDAVAPFGCGFQSQIFEGNGAGALSPGQVIDFACGPLAVFARDFDGDGAVELLLTDGGDFIPAANFFVVAERDTTSDQFVVGSQTFGASAYSLALPVIADLDQDGLLDLAFSGYNDGLHIFLNETVPGPNPIFRRGDANEDGSFNIADAVRLLGALFVPGTPPLTCSDSGDSNDDGQLNIADAVHALAAIFTPGSPPPAQPFPDCGADPSQDSLPDCSQQPAGC